jgi:hypothetical protein
MLFLKGPVSRAVATGILTLCLAELRAADCPRLPPEPPLPDVGVPTLSESDRDTLADFGAALRRFRGLSVEEFLAEYGPQKAYRAGPGQFLRGDANRDRSVDISDAVCILRYLFTGGACGAPSCLAPLDVDASGELELTDAIRLLHFLFLAGRPPAAPFPAPGTDPTPGGLGCEAGAEPGGKLGYDPREAEHLGLIENLFPLNPEQAEAFEEHGFVVLDDRRFPTFLHALSEVYRLHLPLYLSADALLDALHLSFDEMLKTIEEERLIGELEAMLARMDAGIAALEAEPGAEEIQKALDDAALWVCTARSLLAGEKLPCRRGVDAAVEEYLGLVAAERMVPVEFFGSCQVEDFTQFKPRSHYTETEELKRYFRAMMWVQRIGAKFAQIERHAAVAYLLSRLLDETGALEHWRVIDQVVELFVGSSDSLNAPGMLALAADAGVGSAADLRGEGFLRLARRALETGAGRQLILSQVMRADPSYIDGFTPIPPAFHLMGQRFIIDSFIFTNVVYDRVPCPRFPSCRFLPSPLDAWFVLGNRAAAPLLRGELESYQYQAQLAALDWLVARHPGDFWESSLYNLWLSAMRALSADTTGPEFPAVMQTEAWDRRMLQAQLASWAHLRHDTLLYTKESYGGDGCDYPDAWVDPYPEFYGGLALFAERALADLKPLGILEIASGSRIREVLRRFQNVSRELESIARAQLAGEEPSEQQLQFLRSAVRCCGSGGYGGWYTGLILKPYYSQVPLFRPTIADIHTDPNTSRVLHAGVGHPNLMVVTIKNDCGTRAYIGPVLSYFEVVRGGLHRMTDEEWTAQLEAGEQPPRPEWAREFAR